MSPIATPQPSPVEAARLVSPQFDQPADAKMIGALLDTAAGEPSAPIFIDRRQYQLLASHRVLSLVPSGWDVPDPAQLAADKHQLVAKQMLLLTEAAAALTCLSEAGIDSRVLKGVAACTLDYRDPSLRTFGDIDLLIRPERFEGAITALQAHGATRPAAGRGGHEFASAVALTLPSGSEIDLHYRLVRNRQPDTSVDDRLFADPVPLAGGGDALSVEARLVHAATHFLYAAPGLRRLSGLADVSAIRARHPVDLVLVRSLARAVQAEAIVGRALALERILRGLTVDTADWPEPSRLERASFIRPDRQLIMEHVLAMSRIRGVPARARYLAHWLLPTRDQIELRGGFRDYFQRALPRRFGGQYGAGPR